MELSFILAPSSSHLTLRLGDKWWGGRRLTRETSLSPPEQLFQGPLHPHSRHHVISSHRTSDQSARLHGRVPSSVSPRSPLLPAPLSVPSETSSPGQQGQDGPWWSTGLTTVNKTKSRGGGKRVIKDFKLKKTKNLN